MIRKVFNICLIMILAALLLNIPLKTKQAINGVVEVKSIPLYTKVSGFLYRDYSYRSLVRSITKNVRGDWEKVLAIYTWTTENIKRTPEGFNTVDDHIWDIIVRRYGLADQSADVFTTLSSYAGYESFWEKLSLDKVPERIILSFVKIDDKWYMFDIYNKKCLFTKSNRQDKTLYGPTYDEYLKGMDQSLFKADIRRADKQKIIPRIIHELKKSFKR